MSLSSLKCCPEELELPRMTWPTKPAAPPLEIPGSLIPPSCSRIFAHTSTTVFKYDADEGEALMTALAHTVLGPCVPRLEGFVTITGPRDRHGLLLTLRPGTPLSTLWPELVPVQRETVKTNIVDVLVRMRARRFDYYGRPGGRPYVTGEFEHAYCRDRAEWDASRVRALRNTARDVGVEEPRICALSRVQRETGVGSTLVDAPVLTHGDLAYRNILVDSRTLDITGFLDWEWANVAPAYFEYATVLLCGGDQRFKPDLLDILRRVLHIECEREVEHARRAGCTRLGEAQTSYEEALAAWNALVDVERPAQGNGDRCWWTFVNGRAPVTEEL